MIGNKTLVESREKRLNSLTFNITVKNISLLKNPLNSGSPAMEKLPIKATEKRLNSLTFKITVNNISIHKNTLNRGSPAKEKLPLKATEQQTVMKTISPPRRLMSRVPI